nr:hypothetical protein [Tanacetum cinerariifolium]
MTGFDSIVRAFASLGHDLDGIFCKRCTCKSCGKDAHIGYNCPSKVPVISNPEPCNNQTINELPQTLPIFHTTFHSEAESPFTLDLTPTYVDESPNKLPICYDDDDDEEIYYSLDDNIISRLPPFFAITPDEPVLSTEEPDNSLKVMEIVIPEVGGIDDDILLTIKDNILCEKLLNVNLLISKIKALNANPTPSSDCKTKSSSTSLNSLLEETNTFDNSLPEFETFCFDVEEISSGSTTTHPDISLPEYEVFYDDHVKEISSSSPTTHSDSSPYASFMFDLSINPFPPADRIVPYYLLSLQNEDIIFDPGICKSTFSRPDISHRYGTVKKFNTYHSRLNTCPMLIHGHNNPILDVLLFHFYPP